MRIEGTKNLTFQLEKLEYRTDSGSIIPAENLKKPGSRENPPGEEVVFGEEDFQNLTEKLEDFALEIKNTRFEFSVHEETKRVIVRIYDKNTDELISEIPPEKFLDLIANIWKQVGLIIDKRV
ncbi:flagellar protein FlaG [Thermosediminibacter oceani]|uniref:Flagellar protein FlaG protein n=1 Tax=Thermosediminibacter oceani (strain ATCC BAA-1034 / DSM 16646 / JW/IW-1228P) TaxID=555079 RepID=D9RY98_THEOJ|nr:flagellar protein FlaG [Thermosediminibacter oceani]ADL08322.1 flagellar protein FlaG protein [Thermosediminibacter oceani DSM 16646]